MTRNNKGFTLIEIIVIIVVGGIVAAMLVPFMGSALTRSHEPLDNIRKAASVSSDMAKLVAEFRGTSKVCTVLRDDIQATNLEKSDIIASSICCFDDSNELYCDSGNGYPDSENDCDVPVYLLQVKLQQEDNIGETSTFLFPCSD